MVRIILLVIGTTIIMGCASEKLIKRDCDPIMNRSDEWNCGNASYVDCVAVNKPASNSYDDLWVCVKNY